MTQHEENMRRKAIKDRSRPQVRQELLKYCNEDGFIVEPVPPDLLRRGQKLNLFKTFDFGRPDPRGFSTWWFVRFHVGKNYKPPNLDRYLQPTDKVVS